ncbi:GNAT family N-acetyltransferase [Actinoplanes sp. NPDC051343]|uniref:GNAT family N-acetyltransferase n=1 Tax=Actinoplanes sp. NPDC051343 TaxID=3363906 RepID=UPI0037A4EBF2
MPDFPRCGCPTRSTDYSPACYRATHHTISAVCTDRAYRGRGLAARLVRAVAAGIRARGETPFLHTGAANSTAIRLYRSIGFELRRHTLFGQYRLLA